MQKHSMTQAAGIRLAGLFSLSPVIVALVVAILLWVVEYGLAIDLPLVVLVLIYIFWITPNYFFEIVEFRALGNEGWPVFSIESLVARRNQIGVVFTLLVLAATGAFMGLRYLGMQSIAVMALGTGLVFLPASVALLAVTREFRAALNPVRVLAAVAGIGGAYLFCLLAAAGILGLLWLAQERGGLIWYLALIYGLFLDAFLIGSVVYARRRALGVTTPRSPEALAEREQAGRVAVRRGMLNQAYGFATRGNRAGALKHIDAYLATEENTLDARLWILEETARWEDGYVALEFGTRLLDYCEQRGFNDALARVRLLCEHLSERRKRAAVLDV